MLVAGALAGLAVGVRSTFATLVPALAFAAWWLHDRRHDGFAFGATSAFACGVAIALSPLIVFFALDPAAFLYGNGTYNLTLDPAFRADGGFDVAMTFGQKLAYFVGDVLDHPRAAALLAAYAVSSALFLFEPNGERSRAWATLNRRRRYRMVTSSSTGCRLL